MELPSSRQETEPSEDLHHDDLEPSKSQRKRESDEIREFARQLTCLPPRKLKKLPLPVEIEDAIKKCPPVSTRGAHKRHLQYISKLLRKSGVASDLMEILANPQGSGPKPASAHETMREKLLTALPDYVDELRQNYPSADLQQVRQLVRQANARIEITADEEPNLKTITTNKKATKAKSGLLVLLRENAVKPQN